ncbi:hypothetical protein EI555_021438, partial [Monodon monoceros]
ALERTLPVRGLQLSPQPGRAQLRRARKLHRDTPSHTMGRAVGAASNFLPRGAHDHPQLFSKKYGAYLVHSRDFISAQDRPRARNVGAFTDFVQKAKLQKVQGQPRQDSHFPSSVLTPTGSPTLVTGTGLRPWKQASLGASLRCCTARPAPSGSPVRRPSYRNANLEPFHPTVLVVFHLGSDEQPV